MEPGTPAISERSRIVGAEVLHRRFNPSRERLWAKIARLEETLRTLPWPQSAHTEACSANLDRAKACIDRRWGHAHLAWRFLHRIDEDLLLLVSDDEVQARAAEVQTAFELNMTEPAVRAQWLGTPPVKGPLATAVEQLQKPSAASGGAVSNVVQRYLVREALGMVNDHVDRSFWVLSMNVFTTLWSAILLGAMMLLFALSIQPDSIRALATLGTVPDRDLIEIALLGAAGAYVSNLLTRKDFVFVEGGPFTRFLLHPLLVKPVTSAFAASFVYLLAQSRLLFAIVPQSASGGTDAGAVNSVSGAATGGLVLTAPADALGYVYAIVALASGFAADKLLGEMLSSVIRRLEETAEKTKSGEAAVESAGTH